VSQNPEKSICRGKRFSAVEVLGGTLVVTALAFYEGKTLADFELVSLTTNPEIIAAVVELIQEAESHEPPPAKPAIRRRSKLRVVKDVYDDKRG
jgi:hypothetical protein